MPYENAPSSLSTQQELRQCGTALTVERSARILGKSQAKVFAITLSALVTACGGSSGGTTIPVNDDPPTTPVTPVSSFDPATNPSCGPDVQNQWVYNNMLDYYLFYDQVPVVNPQSFSTPEELLSAVRFEERDPFSFLTDAGTSSLQFEEGREFGLGYRWTDDDDDNPRLSRVVLDSPFGRAGLERGDIIVSLNGIAWDEFPSENFRANIFGTPDAPVTSNWQFEKRDSGEIVNLELTSAEYFINTVLHSQRITNSNYNGTIGYLAFSRFLETSANELEEVFQDFRDNNITDLVLDLRYNGGGRIVIAEYLASLIAGDSRANQLLYEYRYNDKYTDENFALQLLDNVGDLGLSRVVIITRGSTASSSEIVVGGLQPYMEVITVGDTTSGKPYVQRGRDRCGRRLNAIEGEGFNAANVSVFGGVPATCYAEDDPTRGFGLDTETGQLETMLKSALDYLVFGTCDAAPVQAAASVAIQRRGGINGLSDNGGSEKQGFVEIGGAVQ